MEILIVIIGGIIFLALFIWVLVSQSKDFKAFDEKVLILLLKDLY